MTTKDERVNQLLLEIEKIKKQIEKEESDFKIKHLLENSILELKDIINEIDEDEPNFSENEKEFEVALFINSRLVTLTLRIDSLEK